MTGKAPYVTGLYTNPQIWRHILPDETTLPEYFKEAVQGYLSSINFADDLTGRVLGALAASDYADNTIVIVFSDHGWHLGEKEHWQKFALWENLIRSVLMVRVPDGYKHRSNTFPLRQKLSSKPSPSGGRMFYPAKRNSTNEGCY